MADKIYFNNEGTAYTLPEGQAPRQQYSQAIGPEQGVSVQGYLAENKPEWKPSTADQQILGDTPWETIKGRAAELGRQAGSLAAYGKDKVKQNLAYGVDTLASWLAGGNGEQGTEYLNAKVPANDQDWLTYDQKRDLYKNYGEPEDPSKEYAGFTDTMVYNSLQPDDAEVGKVGRMIGDFVGRLGGDFAQTDAEKEQNYKKLLATAQGVQGYLGDTLPEQIEMLLGEYGLRAAAAAVPFVAGGVESATTAPKATAQPEGTLGRVAKDFRSAQQKLTDGTLQELEAHLADVNARLKGGNGVLSSDEYWRLHQVRRSLEDEIMEVKVAADPENFKQLVTRTMHENVPPSYELADYEKQNAAVDAIDKLKKRSAFPKGTKHPDVVAEQDAVVKKWNKRPGFRRWDDTDTIAEMRNSLNAEEMDRAIEEALQKTQDALDYQMHEPRWMRRKAGQILSDEIANQIESINEWDRSDSVATLLDEIANKENQATAYFRNKPLIDKKVPISVLDYDEEFLDEAARHTTPEQFAKILNYIKAKTRAAFKMPKNSSLYHPPELEGVVEDAFKATTGDDLVDVIRATRK